MTTTYATVNEAIIAVESGIHAAEALVACAPVARRSIRAFSPDAAGAEWCTPARLTAYDSLLAASRAASAALRSNIDPLLALAAVEEAPSLRCRCGASGRPGTYPFSTNARSGRCDDCQ